MTGYTAFGLASAALFFARDDFHDTYNKWMKVLRRFTELRGDEDPVGDQNANLDVLIRSFEDECALRATAQGFDTDTAGLQLHFQLSRLWVYGQYEFLRRIHVELLKVSECIAKELESGVPKKKTKGCGQFSCQCCAVGHLKNDFAVVRMPAAKHQIAGDVWRPPLPEEVKAKMSNLVVSEPTPSKFLLSGEGMQEDGSIAWTYQDVRIDQRAMTTRRELSDKVLAWDL